MSLVIVGGNKCMECQYKNLCSEYNCRAKVFNQMTGTLKKKIGSPDLVVCFTNTISHKMIKCALEQAKNQNVKIIRCHSSSMTALKGILDKYARKDAICFEK